MGRIKPGAIASRRRSAWSASSSSTPARRTVENVASYRFARGRRGRGRRARRSARETSPGAATGSSSLANAPCELELANVAALTEAATADHDALQAQGVTRQGRRSDRPHRVLRPAARSSDATAAISCSARAAPMTGRPAAPEPAPNLPASLQTAKCAGRSLGAGEHHRQPLSREFRTRPDRRGFAPHHRTRFHLRREQARRDSWRPVPLRVRRSGTGH